MMIALLFHSWTLRRRRSHFLLRKGLCADRFRADAWLVLRSPPAQHKTPARSSETTLSKLLLHQMSSLSRPPAMRTALALLALLISALGPGARGAPAPGLRHGKLPPRGASLPKGHPRVRQPPAAGLQPNVWQRCNYNFNLSRTVANGPPVSLTQYWIAIEGSYDLSDTWDSQILLTGIKNLTIPECDQYGRKISASTLGKTDKVRKRRDLNMLQVI